MEITNNKGTTAVQDLIDSLTAEQMSRLYDIIDGPLPTDLLEMSDEELLEELADL